VDKRFYQEQEIETHIYKVVQYITTLYQILKIKELNKMEIQILITATTKDKKLTEELKEELKKEIYSNVNRFAGSKYSMDIGMSEYLENVDHEVAFENEGTYEWVPNIKRS
jgi:hypothetical protein